MAEKELVDPKKILLQNPQTGEAMKQIQPTVQVSDVLKAMVPSKKQEQIRPPAESVVDRFLEASKPKTPEQAMAITVIASAAPSMLDKCNSQDPALTKQLELFRYFSTPKAPQAQKEASV